MKAMWSAAIAAACMTATVAWGELLRNMPAGMARGHFTHHFDNRAFGELEHLAEFFEGKIGPDGMVLADEFVTFHAFDKCFRGTTAGDRRATADACLATYTPVIADWRAAHPESLLPPIGEAGLYMLAGRYLGRDGQVHFDRAWRSLEAVARDKRTSLWYGWALSLAASAGWGEPRFQALFQEATQRYPSRAVIYRTAVHYFFPSNGGSLPGVMALAELASAHQDHAGVSLYADVIDEAYLYGVRLYQPDVVDWSRLRPALLKRATAFPISHHWLRLGSHACAARDFATMRMAWAKAGYVAPEGQRSACEEGARNWERQRGDRPL